MSENIEMTRKLGNTESIKVDTIELLIIHLSKYISAYRKSYKLCDRVDTTLKIMSGLIGCTAILALVPSIPLLITLTGAIPAGVAIISTKAQFADKSALFKMQHRKLKELLSYVHKMSVQISDEKEIIKEVFSKLEYEKDVNYITPLEMYMKKYKLNGYNI